MSERRLHRFHTDDCKDQQCPLFGKCCIATLERQLAEVTRERDALMAGKWAGPWESSFGGQWVRFGVNPRGTIAEVYPNDHGAWFCTLALQDHAVDIEAARAAADADLVRAGWYLAPQPAPDSGTQLDGRGGDDPGKMEGP